VSVVLEDVRLDSRAVLLRVGDTEMDTCVSCSIEVKSDTDPKWVVCNVYEKCCKKKDCRRCRGNGRRWDRIEHWHTTCYTESSKPYGPLLVKKGKRLQPIGE
jgi:hypothetical protein